MTTRELFEAKFPVPGGIFWRDDRYMFEKQGYMVIAMHHNMLWKGFSAGYEAAQEKK